MEDKNENRVRLKTTTGISIEFTPWTDNSRFKITKLHLYEELGGSVAYGDVDMIHDGTDEALRMITEQNTGKIIIKSDSDKGLVYEIPVCIISRSHLKFGMSADLVCTEDIDFITKRVTETFDDIESALDIAYKGKKDIRTKPDSSVSSTKEFQTCQTGSEFCSKLCGSYKKNVVYALGWEGLLIKDLVGIDSFGNDEPNIVLEDGNIMAASSCQKFTYNNNLLEEPIDCFTGSDYSLTNENYSELAPNNLASIICKDEYHIVGRKYLEHIDNWRYNSRIFNSDLYSSFKIRGVELPTYKLGDVLKYYPSSKDNEQSNPFKVYLVKSNEFFYSNEDSLVTDSLGTKLSWTTLLIGLEEGDWSDISKNQ